MMTDEKLVERWLKDVQIAYNTKAYCESFELYWDITTPLRAQMSDAEQQEMKTIKQAAWDELAA